MMHYGRRRRPNVVVEIEAGHTAQLESWLLGHGRLPAVLPDSPAGCVRYLVKEVHPQEVDDMTLLGARVLERASTGWEARLGFVPSQS